MLINSNNYTEVLEREKENNKILLQQLNDLFGKFNGTFHIASLGNSIASGYSKCDEMIPFLARTGLGESTEKIKVYSYARARKNEDYNVVKWISENISHTMINDLLIQDILEKSGVYAKFNNEQLAAYRQMQIQSTIGLRDFIRLDNNIIIYNCLTGAFTDVLRKGNIQERLQILSCFQKDFENLKVALRMIYLENPNVQIYVCGIPNILGLNLSNMVDTYIKRAIMTVPNAIYIPGMTRNMLFKLENQKVSDVHYNSPEYMVLLNRVLSSIIENYSDLALKNEIISKLYELNKRVQEEESTQAKASKDDIIRILEEALIKFGNHAKNKERVLSEVKKYYDRHYLVDYCCTNRGETKELLSLGKHR